VRRRTGADWADLVSALRGTADVTYEVPPFRSQSLSEAALFRGHRIEGDTYVAPPPVLIEPCACGISIVALSDADEDIVQAVRSHQRMPEHQLYRLRYGGS
jgi:hypothetical protein